MHSIATEGKFMYVKKALEAKQIPLYTGIGLTIGSCLYLGYSSISTKNNLVKNKPHATRRFISKIWTIMHYQYYEGVVMFKRSK